MSYTSDRDMADELNADIEMAFLNAEFFRDHSITMPASDEPVPSNLKNALKIGNGEERKTGIEVPLFVNFHKSRSSHGLYLAAYDSSGKKRAFDEFEHGNMPPSWFNIVVHTNSITLSESLIGKSTKAPEIWKLMMRELRASRGDAREMTQTIQKIREIYQNFNTGQAQVSTLSGTEDAEYTLTFRPRLEDRSCTDPEDVAAAEDAQVHSENALSSHDDAQTVHSDLGDQTMLESDVHEGTQLERRSTLSAIYGSSSSFEQPIIGSTGHDQEQFDLTPTTSPEHQPSQLLDLPLSQTSDQDDEEEDGSVTSSLEPQPFVSTGQRLTESQWGEIEQIEWVPVDATAHPPQSSHDHEAHISTDDDDDPWSDAAIAKFLAATTIVDENTSTPEDVTSESPPSSPDTSVASEETPTTVTAARIIYDDDGDARYALEVKLFTNGEATLLDDFEERVDEAVYRFCGDRGEHFFS